MKPSGKFVLRVGSELHADIQRLARSQNLSLNQFILNALTHSAPEPPLTLALKRAFPQTLRGIVLFGSTVRGAQRADSDIDLLIVLDQSVAIDRSLYHIWDEQIAPLLDPKYSPQFTHFPDSLKGASSLWLEVALEGEILFDGPEHPVKWELQKIRAKIAEGLYTRKMSHGHPYWVRSQENAE